MNQRSNVHIRKTKLDDDHETFIKETNHPKQKLSEVERMLSLATLDHENHSESFSLRLSDSCLDETPDNLNSGSKRGPKEEVIVISDSSSNSSAPINAIHHLKSNRLEHISEKLFMNYDDDIIDSSFSESRKTPVQYFSAGKSKPETQLSKLHGPNKTSKQNTTEVHANHTPQLALDVPNENIVLSDRKKKEILQWLSTNFNSSIRESTSTQDSIPNSRVSGVSSGNSSLERLEQEFETPNNRAKFSKSKNEEKLSDPAKKTIGHQSTLDQYFTKSKTNQPGKVQSNTPKSKSSDKTPVNSNRSHPLRLNLQSKSNRSTPQGSNKIPVNHKTFTPKRIIIPESESLESQPNQNEDMHKTPLTNSQINFKKDYLPPQSSESKSSQGKNSRATVSSLESLQQRKIIPESESFESDSNPLSEVLSNNNRVLDDGFMNRHLIIPESSDESSSSISVSHDSYNNDLGNEKNQQRLETMGDSLENGNTIDDCADILENLYGSDWRNKASTLVCTTEPKKQPTRKIVKKSQTERKDRHRKPEFSGKLIIGMPNKESQNTHNKPQQSFKIPNSKNPLKDSFINDDSTSDSSPNCSYYTALSNPTPSRRLGVPATPIVRTNNNTSTKNVMAICDPDSDEEDGIWKIKDIDQRRLSFNTSTSSSTSEFDPEDIVPPKSVTKSLKVKKVIPSRANLPPQQKKQATKKSFLASLSNEVPLEEADFKAMTYRVKYKSLKEDLCKYLYKLFNEEVFENQLPNDMPIEWSIRLRGTAGKCYNKQSIKTLGNTVRSSRIVLATKVLDSPDRLRDTLIHEMCHAATWLINNVSDGHGVFWKAWAAKARQVFPELPPILRCHDYEIQTKYTYKCVSCGYSLGRHSKSLDLSRKRCGYCHGKFELLINKVTKNGQVQKKSAAQTKQPSGFALYVKENYHLVKQKGLAVKHGEVMKVLGQQFSSIKINAKSKDLEKN
ncbi:hypothetical protein QAD02_003762 [Eretmocerus hayati]|uniref:Uncharacterized protein n=1 Tax=Eretmocerus hayati TaxID=131215 RepID=A0ACC2NMR7_9HYME|nr:hypothetical protein QAD02_003762 [Eretmocerus hayati]